MLIESPNISNPLLVTVCWRQDVSVWDPSYDLYCTLLMQVLTCFWKQYSRSPIYYEILWFSSCPISIYLCCISSILCLPVPNSNISLYMKLTTCIVLLLCSFHKIQWTLQHPSRLLLKVCTEMQMCLVISHVLVSAPRSDLQECLPWGR